MPEASNGVVAMNQQLVCSATRHARNECPAPVRARYIVANMAKQMAWRAQFELCAEAVAATLLPQGRNRAAPAMITEVNVEEVLPHGLPPVRSRNTPPTAYAQVQERQERLMVV